MKKILSRTVVNLEASEKAAQKIAEILKNSGNFSCFLQGGLGAGKTFLVRAILSYFGVNETIPSPTYNYSYEYNGPDTSQKMAHFDFYRLNTPSDFFAKGFEEIAQDPETSCFVEWFEKIDSMGQAQFSGKKFLIKIHFGVGAGMRKIEFLEV